MWRRVTLVRTDVSDERVGRMNPRGRNSVSWLARSSETSVFTRPKRRHIPEDGMLKPRLVSTALYLNRFKQTKNSVAFSLQANYTD
jgi:hypothetical protein